MIGPISFDRVYRATATTGQNLHAAAVESAAAPSAAKPGGDSVRISAETALRFTMAKGLSEGTSSERLASLKAQIQNGTYKIPSGDVADAILNRLSPDLELLA